MVFVFLFLTYFMIISRSIHVAVNGIISFFFTGYPGGSVGKHLPAYVGDMGSIPGSGRSPGEGNGNPLQCSSLENSMNIGAWRAVVHGVPKIRTQLSNHMKSVKVLVTQLCLTLCNPMDCSPPGSSVHGILQARILEWVAISFSRGSSRPRD